MIICGIDPGKRSFACSAINAEGEILKVGYMETVTDLTYESFLAETDKFRASVLSFFDGLKVDYIVAERLTARPGQGGGSVSETINIMLGQLREITRPIPLHLIQASQWKNHYNRTYWDSIPKSCAKCVYRDYKVCRGSKRTCKEYNDKFDASVLLSSLTLSSDAVHEYDAVAIAAYSFEKWENKPAFYQNLKVVTNA